MQQVRALFQFHLSGQDRVNVDTVFPTLEELDKAIDFIDNYMGKPDKIISFQLFNNSPDLEVVAYRSAVLLSKVIGYEVEVEIVQPSGPEVLGYGT